MIQPNSIFRRMPKALPLSTRRLLGALAYAHDGAELSYLRMKEAARAYSMPMADSTPSPELGWTPENRLRIVSDSWACIDNLSRMRRLVTRFPYGDPRPPEVDLFLDVLKPAHDIRNRIQHLDEDIYAGKNCAEGHPVVGTVTWVDARFPDGHARYGISSGPTIDGGTMLKTRIGPPRVADDVGDFGLMAADQAINLDDLIEAARTFMVAFEVMMDRSVKSGVRAAAEAKGVPLDVAGSHWVCDMVTAMFFRQEGEAWKLVQSFGNVEVPPGVVDLTE
jgi:hypothetical protein